MWKEKCSMSGRDLSFYFEEEESRVQMGFDALYRSLATPPDRNSRADTLNTPPLRTPVVPPFLYVPAAKLS